MLAISETAPEAHVAGSTLFYNPAVGSTRNVTVAATTTDAESGIAQVAFPAVFGSDGSDDTSPPYSTSYSWSAGASATGAKSVTATNGSGLTASSSFTVTPDSTGPAPRAIAAPAAGATIQNGQAVSAAPSDADSGVAQVEFRYCAGASCDWSTGTVIGTADSSDPYAVTWTSQPADGPYTLVARATDNVGNTTDSAPLTVTVNNAPPPDTTAPSAPVLAISETAPEAHVAGSTLFYNPAVGSTSNVTVAATTTDAESGIAQVAFPAVFGSDGSDDTSPPYSTSYSWSAGASATGAKSVTATNGSGLTASSSFTVTPDSTGPAWRSRHRRQGPRSRTGKRSPRLRAMRTPEWPRSSSGTAPGRAATGVRGQSSAPLTAAIRMR